MSMDKASIEPSRRVRVRRDYDRLIISYRRREFSEAYGHLGCLPVVTFLGLVLLQEAGDYHGVAARMFGLLLDDYKARPPAELSSFQIGLSWAILVGLLLFLSSLVYSLVAHLVNSHTVELDMRTLTVKQGPLPMTGGVRLGRDQIQQLYVKRERSDGVEGVYCYLWADLGGKERVQLLWSRSISDDLLYMEGLLEKEMTILDKRVAGELMRPSS